MESIGFVFGISGLSFALLGFVFAISAANNASEANAKVDRLQEQLIKAGVIVEEEATE